MSTTESWDAVEARLKAKAAEPMPESWKPENPGDSIAGRIRRYEPGSTGWGDCVICVLESGRTPGRLVSVWIFGTVLANAFERLQPKRGEAIWIEFLGTVTPEGGGSSYKNWRVVVDRDEATEGMDFAEAFGKTSSHTRDTENAEPAAPAPERQEFPTTGDHPDMPAYPADDDIPF